jgi:hypothetical protein
MVKNRYIGAVIIEETLNNMRAGAERLYYTAQVPSLYHVYLHQADYERLQPIADKIIAETKRALDAELASQNRPGRSKVPNPLKGLRKVWRIIASFFGGRTGRANTVLKYERGASDWHIALYPDRANGLKVSDVLIQSRLTLAAEREMGGGFITRTLRTVRTDGVTKSFEVKNGAGPRAHEDGETTKSQTLSEETLQSSRPGREAFALIRYKDRRSNWHAYLMQKEKVNIGKGDEPGAAPGHRVDLTLDFDADVSPFHIQVFFDTEARKFFIKDLSTLGTRINGRLIKSSIGHKGGRVIDLNILEELPSDSRISLATKIILDFKSLMIG